jgi:hypothetical protein
MRLPRRGPGPGAGPGANNVVGIYSGQSGDAVGAWPDPPDDTEAGAVGDLHPGPIMAT